MSTMMSNWTKIEEKLVEMAQTIARLSKVVNDKDFQIAILMNNLEAQNIGESSHHTENLLVIKWQSNSTDDVHYRPTYLQRMNSTFNIPQKLLQYWYNINKIWLQTLSELNMPVYHNAHLCMQSYTLTSLMIWECH